VPSRTWSIAECPHCIQRYARIRRTLGNVGTMSIAATHGQAAAALVLVHLTAYHRLKHRDPPGAPAYHEWARLPAHQHDPLIPHQWDGEAWTCGNCGQQSPDPCRCPCHEGNTE
jgi:hypothetical protein